MSRWPRTVLLAAAVAGIGLVHREDGARPDPSAALLRRAGAAMARAGFAVREEQESWQGGAAKGRWSLLARHRDCAGAVRLEGRGAFNPGAGQADFYIYAGASGRPPGLAAFARAATAMAWNHAMAPADTPRPTTKMLAVRDPSACLAITGTDWHWVWFGGRAA